MRVAVTGLSIWSCFGRGPESIISAMRAGSRLFETVRLPLVDLDDRWFKTKRAMQISVPAQVDSAWEGRPLPTNHHEWPCFMAVQTALDAVIDAGRSHQNYEPDRVAVCNGTSHGSNHGLLEYLRQDHFDSSCDASLLADLPSVVSGRIAQSLGVTGPCLTLNTACSAGINAIGQGLRLIEAGRADCVVAGAHDSFSALSFAGFTSLKALDPGGCRPFDRNRDGLSLGDGAAYVVLERAPSRPPIAWIEGYGCAGEAYHPTAPDPHGLGIENAMRAALRDVRTPERLAFVSAHGTGTAANDEAELLAISRVVAAIGCAAPVDVVSLKSQIGHGLGAAGAMQVVAAVLAMSEGLVPANVGLMSPVDHPPAIRLPTKPVARWVPLALCNSLGFGGSIAAIAISLPDLDKP